MYKGSLEAEMDPNPLILIAGEEPGWPFELVVAIPGAAPINALATLVKGLSWNSFAVRILFFNRFF